MRNFKKKLHGQEGFTLVEMLIVVAIIAILIAVSIPIIRSALDKARHSTDAANERAAKAAILVKELSDPGSITAGTNYYYNVKTGNLDATFPTLSATNKGYGQHKATGGDHTAGTNGSVIAIQIDASDNVKMQWTNTNLSTTPPNGKGLCSTHEWNVDHSS